MRGDVVAALARLTSTAMARWNGMSSRPSSSTTACTVQRQTRTPSTSAWVLPSLLRRTSWCSLKSVHLLCCRYHPLNTYLDLTKHFAPIERMSYLDQLDRVS